MLFHLSIFFLVPRLPAPAWAKAAGYGWAIIDTTVGAMVLNGVPREVAMPMRLGGHIFAGTWILGTSLSGSTSIRLIGCIAGIWVSAFTFVARFVPQAMLRPASLLVLASLACSHCLARRKHSDRPSEQMKLRDQTPGAYGILEEQSGSDDTPRDALAVPAAVGHFDSDKAPTKDRVDAKISVLMR